MGKKGNLKHFPTCPKCGTSGPHRVAYTQDNGDKVLQCMGLKRSANKHTGEPEVPCSHKWNHTKNMREREVNWAWLSQD